MSNNPLLRPRFLVGLSITLVGLTFLLWPYDDTANSDRAVSPQSTANVQETGAALNPVASATAASGNGALGAGSSLEEFPIAAPLNRPGGTIAQDLDTVSQLFDAWRSNFPGVGNPVGENADITRALTGDNSLKLVLVPPTHSAINANGELCDRWGTPFRFHQLSGSQMEIVSAGPDRRFGTEDDARWNPVP